MATATKKPAAKAPAKKTPTKPAAPVEAEATEEETAFGVSDVVELIAVRTGKTQAVRYQNKQGTTVTHTATPATPRPSATNKTGTTYEAPKVKVTRVSAPKTIPKDKL